MVMTASVSASGAQKKPDRLMTIMSGYPPGKSHFCDPYFESAKGIGMDELGSLVNFAENIGGIEQVNFFE